MRRTRVALHPIRYALCQEYSAKHDPDMLGIGDCELYGIDGDYEEWEWDHADRDQIYREVRCETHPKYKAREFKRRNARYLWIYKSYLEHWLYDATAGVWVPRYTAPTVRRLWLENHVAVQ